ncbi:MAG: DUF2993 domain-containing protein [Cyanobacteria bacterium J06560_2]
MDVVDEDGSEKKGGSRIIGRILPAAVGFWLRSQVEEIAQLEIDLEGRDRQILKGFIPGVAVSAQQAIYRGIHVGQVQLSAKDIRINIGQVVRGKPLRLLKTFPVTGAVVLSEADLKASLRSPLLSAGLLDFWRSLISIPAIAQDVKARYGSLAIQPNVVLSQPNIRLEEGCLGLSFYPCSSGNISSADSLENKPVVLGAKLSVVSAQYLQLSSPCWLTDLTELSVLASGSPVGIPVDSLEGFQWNLGQDTQLNQLETHPDRLVCSGVVTVQP